MEQEDLKLLDQIVKISKSVKVLAACRLIVVHLLECLRKGPDERDDAEISETVG